MRTTSPVYAPFVVNNLLISAVVRSSIEQKYRTSDRHAVIAKLQYYFVNFIDVNLDRNTQMEQIVTVLICKAFV